MTDVSASRRNGRNGKGRVGRSASCGLASSCSRNSARSVATTRTGPARAGLSSSANRERAAGAVWVRSSSN